MSSRRGGFESFSRWLNGRASLRFPLGVAFFTLVVGSLAVVLLVPGFSVGSEELFSNVVTVVVAAAVPVTSGWAAVRARGRTRAAWWLMAAAGASWLVGELLWLLEAYVLLLESVPAPSDAFYLLALLPAAAALVLFPAPVAAGPERNRMLLAAVVVAGAVLFVSRALAFSVILPAASGSWLAQTVFVAYPTADVVLASLALIVLVRSGSRARLHFVLLTIGFLCYSIADTLYVRAAAMDDYAAGSLLDLGWVVGYALFALAPLVPYASWDVLERPRTTETRVFEWSSLALYLPLLAAVVVAAASPSPVPDPVLIVTGLVTLLTFAAHQALLAGDHTRLRTALESQVGQLKIGRAELRQLASQNERIVQSVVDGVLGVDAEGLITFVNPQAVAMLGRSATDLLRSPEALLLADLPRSSSGADGVEERQPSDVARALVSGTVVSSARARFVTGAGAILPVELAVGPILEDGQITGAVVVFRDVSARLAVEKMKDEFVSVVSHELRTPLTSIRGSLGLLAGGMGGELSPQGDRMVKVALDSSERLTRLISDMLDLERMESGSLTMVPVVCEVRSLVNTALNEVDAMARQYGVRISAEGIDGIVRGDADRIVQTLTNVLGNSVKFSPRGGTVTVSTSQRGEMVEFAIADHGRGIPADRLDRIFERFEQVDSSDSRVRGGTGLGLPISRDIITLHGGSIWVESELGEGSVFRFTLPGTVRQPRPGQLTDEELQQPVEGVVG